MTEKVQVVTRLRPPTQAGGRSCVVPLDDQRVCVANRRIYDVDRVYGASDTTEFIFYDCVATLVDRFIAGYNATVLAYGQTGSGKTFTMSGLAPLILRYVVERMGGSTKGMSFQCVEVYGEVLRDLLTSDPVGSAKHLHLHENDPNARAVGSPNNGNCNANSCGASVVVVGAARVKARTFDEINEIIDHSTRMRATGATQMNEHSSRSHSIFTVFNHERQSKLNLVDLAGSERNKKTHNVGQRFRESCAINGGLLALGNVIRALSRNHFNCPENPQHIPYRSSKLTRLLQDSLGGNSTTLLIACISSDADNTSETMRTLQYSALASRILNEPLFHFDEVNAAGSAGEEGGVGRRTSTTNEAARGCSKMPESVSDSAEVAALRQRVAGLEEQLKRCREELKNDEAAFAQQIEYTKSLICENETLRKRLAAFERQAHSPAATPPSTAPAVRAQSMLGASAQKEMRHTVRHHWECMQQGGTNAVAPNVQDTKSGSPIKPFNGVHRDIRRVSPLNNTSDATKYVWRGENLPTNAHTPHRSVSIPGPSNINTWNQADKNAELPENISNINFVNDGESTYYELEKHAPEKEGRLAMLAKEALYYQNSNSELRRRLRAVLKMHEAQQHETTMLRREVEQIRELIDGGCQL